MNNMKTKLETEVNHIVKQFYNGTIPYDTVLHYYTKFHDCIKNMYECNLIVRETQRKYESMLQPLIEIIIRGN